MNRPASSLDLRILSVQRPLDKLTLRGFKSIESLDAFELTNCNILIGANGAGKSNFIDFFRLLRDMADKRLQSFVNEQGGGDGFFYLGPKQTPRISASLSFEANGYEFSLAPTADGSIQIGSETVVYGTYRQTISRGAMESHLKEKFTQQQQTGFRVAWFVYKSLSSWTVYHFHDTGSLAPMRRIQPLNDDEKLRHDASNIAAYLNRLREEDETYDLIRDTVRLIAPFFDDFLFRPKTRNGNEQIRLEWTQRGSDFPFQPSQLSDGTIRFICLATALMQPDPPATILIDEPELGLHPYAISILASLIESASQRTQVIVSTQSPTLLDYFGPDQIIVVNRVGGKSAFERLDEQQLGHWLEEYSVGELWQKNVVRGGPARE